MNIFFDKYQGTGNDFILIDDRALKFPVNKNLVKSLCNRHNGIGSDGLILIQNSIKANFKMVYYNSDGKKGSFCGNGSRCAISFANRLYNLNSDIYFEAFDGIHIASIGKKEISVKMLDVKQVECFKDYVFLDTGSPHHVIMVEDLNRIDVNAAGSLISSGPPYFEKGVNVNFVEKKSNKDFNIRTYERGVKSETLSCGTGAVAVAIAMFELNNTNLNNINIKVKGGQLTIKFSKIDEIYSNICLIGPATNVFSGQIII
tara:strand:- start:694 stop:1470 length:777 start_codon:yes stop_codon:yes gene_type:complete